MTSNLASKALSGARSAVHAHLEWVHGVTTKRPAVVLAICCLLFLICSVAITRIHFEADIFKMFPKKGPLSLFVDIMRWTGSSGNAYFLLEGDRDQLIQEAPAFAERLRQLEVDGAPGFKKVSYTVFDPAQAEPFAAFVAYAVTRPQLFLSAAELPSYLERLSPERMEASLQRAKAELAAPGSLSELVRVDPLYLRNQILPRLKSGSESLAFDPASPYFLSRDGRILIIIAEPARPVTDMPFSRKLVAGINKARSGSSLSISCAGAHLSAVTDEAVMKKNVIEGVFLSLAIVLALFYASYRRFLPTLLIPVILCYSVIVSVALGGMIYPTMSIISFAFAALIVGIGTDYSVHLYDRFHFERAAGVSSERALQLAVVDTGHALFTAATTTGLPFLALLLSDVRALAERGLLVGLGVIISLYVTLFFLPPLLLFMERRFPLEHYPPLPQFGLGQVWSVTRGHRGKILAACLAVVLASLFYATGVRFESELKNLQPKSSEAFQAQEKLEKHLTTSPKEMIVAVEGKELGEVVARGEKVAALAEHYQRQGELVGYSSLLKILNGMREQEQVLARLKSWPDSSRLKHDINRTLERESFAPEPFRPYVNEISGLSRAQAVPLTEALQQLSMSPFRGIVERFLPRSAEGYHLLTYLNYRGEEFKQELFLHELATAVPGARTTGLDLVSRQLTASVRESFVWAVGLGAGLVLLLLLSHFNSLPGILYSLFPLFSGVSVMLGVMALADRSLNFMNVMVLVTIVGMGSDFGLHIGHRVRNCSEREYLGRYIQSGRAVLLSGLTTVAGFGSLALTDYTAMASIGWATNVGVIATVIFTLTAVPALMALLSASEHHKPTKLSFPKRF